MSRNHLLLLVTLLFILIPNFSGISQVSGYLGHRVQFEASFAPTINTGFLANTVSPRFDGGSVRSIEDDDGVLLGGQTNGVSGLNIFSGSEFSLSYIVSRKATVGISYGASRSYGLVLIERESDNFGFFRDPYLVPFQVRSIQLKGDFYSAIAPLQKFYRVGLGVDLITANTTGAEPEVRSVGNLRTYESSSVFFTLGIGGNYYFTDNFYASVGLDLNISSSFFIMNRQAIFSNTELEFLPYRHLFTTRLLQGQIGVGFSL